MTDILSIARGGFTAALLVATVVLSGCTRGHYSEEPPIHLNPNMDQQEKFRSQSRNTFFENESAMREPVAGTVAQGWLKDDLQTPLVVRFSEREMLLTEQTETPAEVEALSGFLVTLQGQEIAQFYTGRESGEEEAPFIAHGPLPLNHRLLDRGRDRFTIYCAPCHGNLGDGDGMIVRRGMLKPTSYFDDRLVSMPDGQIFNTITNGLNNMPSYRHQIPVADRWAIISYVRALQQSGRASLDEVPGGKSALPQP